MEPLGYPSGDVRAVDRGLRRRRRLRWASIVVLVGLPMVGLVAVVLMVRAQDAADAAEEARTSLNLTLTVVNQTSGPLTNAGFDSEGDGIPEDLIGPLAPGQSRRAKQDVPWYETPISLGVVTAAGTATAQIDYQKMFRGAGLINCTMVVLPGHVRLRCSSPKTGTVTADLRLSPPNPNLR